MLSIAWLRHFRIGPFAIFDFAVSYLAMYFLAPLLTKLFSLVGLHVTRSQWMWLVIPISIVVHILDHQNTPLTKMFLNLHGDIIVKAIVIYMLYKGIRG